MKKSTSSKAIPDIDFSHNFNQGIPGYFSKWKSEYVCLRLEDFLNNIDLPTPPTKEKGLLLILVTDGDFNVKVGYSDYSVKKSELMIIQPQKPFYMEKSSATKGIIFYIKGDGIIGTMGSHSLIFNLDFLETWSQSHFPVKDYMLRFFENIFERVLFEYQNQSNNLTIVNAYAITLLFELNIISKEFTDPNSAAVDLTHRLKKMVYQHLDSKLTISDYAEMLSVTPNHLNKSVKSVTGSPATHLLNRIKVIEAKYLLSLSEFNITQVAEKSGFDDPSYFSRFFKKHAGVTPVEFRRMLDGRF